MDFINQIGGWLTSISPDQRMGAGSAGLASVLAAFAWRTMRPHRVELDAKLIHRRAVITEVFKAVDPVPRGVTLKERSV